MNRRHFDHVVSKFLAAVFCMSFAILAGCGGGGSSAPPTPPATLQSMTVSPKTSSVAAGQTDQFTATGTFSDGSSKAVSSATWTTSDTTLATVDASGLLKTLKAGTVTVSAVSGSISGSTSLTIGAPILQTVNITPQMATVAAGLTDQLSAAGVLTDGTAAQLSSVTWSSSDTTTATVDPTGLVTSLKQGTVKITATSSSITGSVTLTVNAAAIESIALSPQTATVAAGFTDQFSATGTFSDGSTKVLSSLTWSTSDPTFATVNASGLVTTLKQGTVTVSATTASVTGNAQFAIAAPIPVSLSVSPGNATLKLGATPSTALSAILTLSDKSTQDVSSQATWSSSNSTMATVDNTGNVTGLLHGYVTISASAQSFSSTSAITILAFPRYLYFSTDAGREITRAPINANSGQLNLEGFFITGANNIAFPCQTSDPLGQFLYTGASTSNGTSGEILIHSIDQNTGALTQLTGSPFSMAAPVGCIHFDPTGKFGYANSSINGTVDLLAYSRDPNTGLLTLTNTYTLSGSPSQVAVDPLGKYLYVATIALTPNTAQAYGFSIDPTTGALTAIQGTPFSLPDSTGTFSFHPSGNFVYMANSNGSSIDTYSVDRTTGKLTKTSSLTGCANPTTVRFNTNGNFAYSSCSTGSLDSFAVSNSGALSLIGTAIAQTVTFDLVVDPSDQFIYASPNTPYVYAYQIGSNGVATFQRKIGIQPNQGGTLVALGGSSPVTYSTKFAFVSSTGDNNVTTYAVQTDGIFDAGQSARVQLSPFSLSILPWGSNLLFASTPTSSNLLAIAPNPTTGALSNAFFFGDTTTEGGIAIDPSGQWAFATDTTGLIRTYGHSGTNTWGIITYTPQGSAPFTTFAAGAGAGPVIVDPAGVFVYVANQAANSISAYFYPGTSPELTEATTAFVSPFTDGSPYSLGAKPLAFAVDSNGAFLYVICADQTLRVFSIDYFSAGHLSQVASVSLAGSPAGLAAEPTGHFVYTGDSTGVSAFSVNSQSGALTPITLNPAITTANVSGVYVDPSGKYLYVATSQQSVGGAVFAYTINSDGTLTAVSSLPIATPDLPSSMVFSADVH